MKIIHLAGAKGVGKSTVLEESVKSNKFDSSRIEIIHTSKYLFKICKKYTDKAWSDFTEKEKVAMRSITMNSILRLDKEIVILDSHCIDMKGAEPIVILSDEFKKHIDIFAVLEASPEVIHSRRAGDVNRTRDNNINNIEQEVFYEKEYSLLFSIDNNVPFVIIENIDLQDTIANILNLTENILTQINQEQPYEHRIYNIKPF